MAKHRPGPGGGRAQAKPGWGFGGEAPMRKAKKQWRQIVVTDHNRWLKCVESYSERNQLMAKHVLPGSSVLDVGAGQMTLKGYLPEKCSYTPLDLFKRTEDTLVCDLNNYEWPEGCWDVAICSGVIEYVRDYFWLLERLRDSANLIVASYHNQTIEKAKEYGFLSELRPTDFWTVANQIGMTVLSRSYHEEQTIWVMSPFSFESRFRQAKKKREAKSNK